MRDCLQTTFGERFATKAAFPKTSMGFVKLLNLTLDANIIDIGGGTVIL